MCLELGKTAEYMSVNGSGNLKTKSLRELSVWGSKKKDRARRDIYHD